MSISAASQQATQTAIEHLHELWRRCLYCVALLILGGAAGYVFRQPIINFLQHPLHEKLYYTSPMGSFNFIMQLCLLVGFIVALPVICYNILRFVEPALPKRLSTRLVLGVLAISYVLALGGAAFAYYIVLPATLHFFGTISGGTLDALITVDQYFSFVLSHLGIFAAIFQMPLLLLFANHISPFGPGSLRKARKFVFVGSFAISIVIPMSPDPLSQASLALPIIILFELSVFLVWLKNRKQWRQVAEGSSAPHRQPETKTRTHTPIPHPRHTAPVRPAVAAAKATSTVAAVKQVPAASRQALDVFMPTPTKNQSSSLRRRNFQQPVARPHAPSRLAPRQTARTQLISDVLT